MPSTKKTFPSLKRMRYRSYNPSNLSDAYTAVIKGGVSVYRAAKVFSVPQQTLRDRVNGVTSPDTTMSGPGPLLSFEHEARLVDHIKHAASMGYSCNRAQVVRLSTEYAINLGKMKREDNSLLSLKWFYKFLSRWPELKVKRPKTVPQLRAYATLSKNVESYFVELEAVLDKHDLKDSPERVYVVDEIGISMNDSTPLVVASADEVPIDVSATIAILGCGNAFGQQVPAYLVFPGTRMRSNLLEGSSAGTSGTVSKSGWSNSDIFEKWLEEHFSRFASIVTDIDPDKMTLLLYDGNRSLVTPSLIDIAESKGIVLFALPPHASRALQPKDVGFFGPFEKIFGKECRKWERLNNRTVNRYNVCPLVCRTYERSLTVRHLQSAFRKCGIFPFNPMALDRSFARPAESVKQSQAIPSDSDDRQAAASDSKTAESASEDGQAIASQSEDQQAVASESEDQQAVASESEDQQAIAYKSEDQQAVASESEDQQAVASASDDQQASEPEVGASESEMAVSQYEEHATEQMITECA